MWEAFSERRFPGREEAEEEQKLTTKTPDFAKASSGRPRFALRATQGRRRTRRKWSGAAMNAQSKERGDALPGAVYSGRRATWVVVAVVFAFALAVNLAVAFKLGMTRPMASDALYFKQIAANLANGQGYRLSESFWPDSPTMSRSPGWPLLVAAALKCAPGADADVSMRWCAIGVNSVAAVVVALLAFRLFARPVVGLLSGAVYAVHPTALYETYNGLSEPLLILSVATGILLLLSERRWAVWVGFFLMGYAGLVRPNFLVWPIAAAVLAAAVAIRRRVDWRRLVLVGSVGLVLAFAPPLAWALRNRAICGHFPVLSTLRGQTFYGGNNPVVANDFEYWGYWVFPNAIPGETPMAELAKTKTEYEVDVYYYEQGKAYIAGHLAGMPRLCLGKLVRAYLPVPWKPSLGTLTVSAYRWLLYGLAVAGVVVLWRRTDLRYRVALGALLMTSLVTVLGFWGCARFAFGFEPFLIPLAVAAVGQGAWSREHRA